MANETCHSWREVGEIEVEDGTGYFSHKVYYKCDSCKLIAVTGVSRDPNEDGEYVEHVLEPRSRHNHNGAPESPRLKRG